MRKVKLGRTKAGYLTTFGIGETFEKETIDKLKNCDAFSIQIDESEVNKVSQLEIRANLSSKGKGIERRHFKVVDLEAGDAGTITETVLEAFIEDGIDVKGKLIDIGMDGCSTMQGIKNGVITRMMKEIPQLRSTGSCNSHNLANTMKHATEKFDPDIKLALVDLYQDIGGSKGKGLKKKKEFEAVARDMGLEPKPVKRFVDTRFRTLLVCISPVLHNYLAIVKYYRTLKKPTDRQKRLQAFFVDREDKSRIELKFLIGTTEFTAAIDFFEESQAHVHNTKDKLEQILVGQLGKILDDKHLNNLDAKEELVRKPTVEIVNLEIDEAEVLPNKKIFVGQEVNKELKSLGLSPQSVQIKWFYEKVKTFHVTAAKFLLKYFKVALSDEAMDNMVALDPKKQSHFLTPRKLTRLSNQYSKIVDNIDLFGGQDKIQEEVKMYVVDEDVKVLEKKDYEGFWKSVGDLQEGDWPKYDILPRFALAMGTKNSATGDVERSFSTMNLIHQNRQRNCMRQETLDAHLHIRSGVECEEIIEKCDKCEKGSRDHCHCVLTIISTEMKSNCRKAWEKCKVAQGEAASIKEHVKESNEEKYNKVVSAESERIQKLKEKLCNRSDFLSSGLMKPVYEKPIKGAGSKEGRKEKNEEGGSKDDQSKQGGSKVDKNNAEGNKVDKNKSKKPATWKEDQNRNKHTGSKNKGESILDSLTAAKKHRKV